MALFEILYQFTAKYKSTATEYIRADSTEKAIQKFLDEGLCRTREKIIAVYLLKGF
jgi:hypothetical protein